MTLKQAIKNAPTVLALVGFTGGQTAHFKVLKRDALIELQEWLDVEIDGDGNFIDPDQGFIVASTFNSTPTILIG